MIKKMKFYGEYQDEKSNTENKMKEGHNNLLTSLQNFTHTPRNS